MIPTFVKKESSCISVWLDDSHEEILKKFHCVICGKIVFEYYNSIKLIVCGEHFEKRPKVIQCHGSILIDRQTSQSISPKNRDPNADQDRYIETKCKTKYWIS